MENECVEFSTFERTRFPKFNIMYFRWYKHTNMPGVSDAAGSGKHRTEKCKWTLNIINNLL